MGFNIVHVTPLAKFCMQAEFHISMSKECQVCSVQGIGSALATWAGTYISLCELSIVSLPLVTSQAPRPCGE